MTGLSVAVNTRGAVANSTRHVPKMMPAVIRETARNTNTLTSVVDHTLDGREIEANREPQKSGPNR